MEEYKCAPSRESAATYQVENRQFIVRRKFAAQGTLSDILAAEISSGLLKNSVLNSSPDYRIMKP